MPALGLALGLPYGHSAAPAFSPLDNTKLSEWWSVESLVAGGAGPVGSWAGRKGVYTPTASTTARPTFTADDGDGKPAVLFDGVDDQMTCSADDTVLYGPTFAFEAWFVIRGVSSGAIDRGFFATNFGSSASLFLAQTSQFTVYSRSRANFSNAFNLQDGNWHLVRVVMSDGLRKVFVDGADLGWNFTGGTAAAPPGNNTLLIGGDSSLWLGGMRHAAFFSSLLTDNEAAAVQTYMEAWT